MVFGGESGSESMESTMFGLRATPGWGPKQEMAELYFRHGLFTAKAPEARRPVYTKG